MCITWLNSGAASGPPPKPWERAGSSSGAAPFRPPSAGNTSEVVEASGTAQPGEVVSTTNANVNRNTVNTVGRPVPARPWEQQQTYGSTYGGRDEFFFLMYLIVHPFDLRRRNLMWIHM